MRMRTLMAMAVLTVIAAGCGDDDSGATTTQPDDGNGGVTTTAGGNPIGGGEGSITFQISGDYEASGEFPFLSVASAFNNGGWSATFADSNNSIIVLNTFPGSFTVSFGDPQAVITGIESSGCVFDFDQNDASGLVGSFDCSNTTGFLTAGTEITVDFAGQFSGNP